MNRHCWHIETFVQVGPTIRQEVCCLCGARRKVRLVTEALPGHGPHLPVFELHAKEVVEGEVPECKERGEVGA